MSEIPVTLTRSRYENKIALHSQYVRWLQATTCFCVSQAGDVDPRCPACLGRGYIYKHQTVFDIFGENSPHCGQHVRPRLTPLVGVSNVVRHCEPYTIKSFSTSEIIIELANVRQAYPSPWQTISVDYQYSIEKEFSGEVEYKGAGICKVPLQPVFLKKSGGFVVGDILYVVTCNNVTKGINYTSLVVGINRDELYLVFANPSQEPDDGDVITAVVKYIDPFAFMLMGVSEKMRWADAYVITGGDAVMTVPYNVYIGDGDVIVQLIGEQRGSAVFSAHPPVPPAPAASWYDELPAFDVSRVLFIRDSTNQIFTEYQDFVLKRGNQIHWLETATVVPTGNYTVSFLYHPAFKVFGTKPSVRTPENLRMPRKVNLSVFDKVNVNYDLDLPNTESGS